MAERVLGTVFTFRAEGLPQVQQSVRGFTSMSSALDGFVGKTMQLGASGAAIAGFGYAITRPLNLLKQSFFEVGASFENIMLRFESMSKRTGASASQMFDFVAAAAYNIPYSFDEALEVTQQFDMMGVKLNKTYGEMKQLGETVPITYANAMSGLAAKSGATFTQVAHHIRSAIQAGRADFLEYWIGPAETQMMKMSGVFVGTWQEQFDKVINYLGPRFAGFSAKMSESLESTMIGFSDLRKRVLADIAGVTNPSARGTFWGLERMLAITLRDLTMFFYKTNEAMPKALGYGAKLGSLFSDILLPLQMQFIRETKGGEFFLGGMAAKAMEKFQTFIKWLVAPENRQAIVNISRFAIALGYLSIAFGTWLTVMRIVIPLFGMFVTMAAPFTLSFGLIAAAALMAINILRTNWKAGAVSFVGVLDWLKVKLDWAANFFKIAFQIMTGAGVGGRGAWVSEAAWSALGPKSQAALLSFMRGWLWLKDHILIVINFIRDHWKGFVNVLVGSFNFIVDKLKWMGKHWIITLGGILALMMGKKVMSGIWGFLFGTRGDAGGGGGGGMRGAIPVYVVNWGEGGGGAGGGGGGSKGVLGWVWWIFKQLTALSFVGFAVGISKLVSYIPIIGTTLAKWFTMIGVFGDKFWGAIFNVLMWLVKSAPMIGMLLIKGIVGAISFGIGYLLGTGLDKLFGKIFPFYKTGWSATTQGVADMLFPMGKTGALEAQQVNLSNIMSAVRSGQISKEQGAEYARAASVNPQFNAEFYIQTGLDMDNRSVAEKIRDYMRNFWDEKMTEIDNARVANGEKANTNAGASGGFNG